MAAKITLWGFNGSTYVRSVRMLLAEKGVGDYEQVPVNVLKKETQKPEHLARHPFGKVPVVEVDGFKIIETPAILRYLDRVVPGPALVPADAKNAARADMVISIIDSYGYGAMIGGVAAYHLFPDFVGGKNEEARASGLAQAKAVFTALFALRGGDPYLAGPALSVADLYLAPLAAYLSMTPDWSAFTALDGVSDWWGRISSLESFKATQP